MHSHLKNGNETKLNHLGEGDTHAQIWQRHLKICYNTKKHKE